MEGKRHPLQQGGPPAKRGPISEFDDMIEEDLAGDDAEAAYLPDDLDEAEPDLGEAGRNWLRPSVTPMDSAKDSLGRHRCRKQLADICMHETQNLQLTAGHLQRSMLRPPHSTASDAATSCMFPCPSALIASQQSGWWCASMVMQQAQLMHS